MIKIIEKIKCVLIFDSSLSVGDQANVVAVAAITPDVNNRDFIR